MKRRFSRRNDRGRRLISTGDTFTIDDELAGLIELETPPPDTDWPEKWRGEQWGWTKPDPSPEAQRFTRGDYPPGYREEGDDGPD